MSKIVKSKLSELPPLTEEQLEELRVLASRADSETDTSDIPELSKERWLTLSGRILSSNQGAAKGY